MIETTEEFVYSIADENNCLPWRLALKIVSYHYMKADFLTDFREYIDTDINADILLQWLGY